MESIEIRVILDWVKGDCAVHLSLLEGPRESLSPTAIVVKDTLHLCGREILFSGHIYLKSDGWSNSWVYNNDEEEEERVKEEEDEEEVKEEEENKRKKRKLQDTVEI